MRKTKLYETHCHLTNSLSPVPRLLSLYAMSGDKGVSDADSFCSIDPRVFLMLEEKKGDNLSKNRTRNQKQGIRKHIKDIVQLENLSSGLSSCISQSI